MLRWRFFVLLFIYLNTQAQTNLVPNGDFEENTGCPQGTNSFTYLKFWKKCSSPDYFHPCTFNNYFNVPDNAFGFQMPFSGNAYVGLTLFVNTNTFREYIKIKLVEDLKVDTPYKMVLYYSIADSSKIITSNLDALLSSSEVFCTTNSGQISRTPQINLIGNTIPTYDTIAWNKVEVCFIPDSNYSHIMIGNFNSDQSTNIYVLSQNSSSYAYYYIDRLSIEQLHFADSSKSELEHLLTSNTITPNKDGKNDVFRLVPNERAKLQRLNSKVFNRWGQLVYSSNNISFEWDGTFKGEPVELGAYPYIMEYTLLNEQKSRTKSGWVHVLY